MSSGTTTRTFSPHTVYIAGPMRGIERFNFPAFDFAAAKFRDQGFNVINPADIDRDADPACEGLTDAQVSTPEMLRVYAERDTRALLTCTHIAMLPGWRKSKGATAEYHFARWIGLEVLDAETGNPLGEAATARDRLLMFHEQICERGRDLMRQKNHDYAGRSGNDPFANFRRTEQMGVCTTEQGFLVRLTDKLSRLATFCEGGDLLVKDESVADTLVDVINYAVLFGAYLDEQKTRVASYVAPNE
jgi:hypothetical protein